MNVNAPSFVAPAGDAGAPAEIMRRKFNRGAFTLIELLVVVGVILVLAALLMPVGKSVLAASKASRCAANLRQISVGIFLYAGEHDGTLPYGYNAPDPNTVVPKQADSCWDTLIMPYLLSDLPSNLMKAEAPYLKCPGDTTPAQGASNGTSRRSYSMIRNAYGHGSPPYGVGMYNLWTPNLSTVAGVRLTAIPNKAATAMITDSSNTANEVGGTACACIDYPNQQATSADCVRMHGGKFNYLFVDGHIEFLDPKQTYGSGSMTDPRGIWSSGITVGH